MPTPQYQYHDTPDIVIAATLWLIHRYQLFWDRLVLPIKHARKRYQLHLTRNLILTK